VHRLDDNTLVTPFLLKRFQAEAEFGGADGAHFAVLQRSNGDILVHNTCGPECGPNGRMLAIDLLNGLNEKLNFGGAWVLVFTHFKPPAGPFMQGEYDRFVLMWMDHDGDVQLPVEYEGTAEQAMAEIGFDGFMNNCQEAHDAWKIAHEMLDARPEEKFKRAKGQPRPSLH